MPVYEKCVVVSTSSVHCWLLLAAICTCTRAHSNACYEKCVVVSTSSVHCWLLLAATCTCMRAHSTKQ